jgi:hypothetical protein
MAKQVLMLQWQFHYSIIANLLIQNKHSCHEANYLGGKTLICPVIANEAASVPKAEHLQAIKGAVTQHVNCRTMHPKLGLLCTYACSVRIQLFATASHHYQITHM